jgi:hypothetical protein
MSASQPAPPGYLNKLEAVGAVAVARDEEAVVRFLESLNELDWEQLCADALFRRPGAWQALSPRLGYDLVGLLSLFVKRLSFQTHEVLGRGLERFLRRQLGAFGSGSELEVLDQALFLASQVRTRTTTDLFCQLIGREDLPAVLRERAGLALSDRAEELPLDFWLQLDFQRFPELVTAATEAIATPAPRRTLELLAGLPASAQPSRGLRFPLVLAFRSLERDPGGAEQLATLRRWAPDWLVAKLSDVLAESEFEDFRLRVDQSEVALSEVVRALEESRRPSELSGILDKILKVANNMQIRFPELGLAPPA